MTKSPLTLYWAKGTCSFAVHIALREAAAPVDLVRVDLRTRKTAAGDDLARVTPKGYVPALRLADGTVLTETAIILQHLADLYPEARLAPPRDDPSRLRFDERIQFIATELHKAFAPFTIMPNPGEEAKAWAKARLDTRIALLAEDLGDKPFFDERGFTIADAYAYYALVAYRTFVRAELPAPIAAYAERIAARPSVRAAVEAEKS
ncbi:MAG: glutathione transferase GstA [Polyangiaceae bacterium]|nr:glutathione transferase GstA [Polyangiaceae bacterium]